MNPNRSRTNGETSGGVQTVDLLGLFETLFLQRWRIAKWTFCGALLLLITSIVIPPRYRGEISILPPDTSSSPLTALASQIPLDAFVKVPSPPSQLFVEMLRSRSVCARVVNKRYPIDGDTLDLVTLWGKEHLDFAIRELRKRTKIKTTESGLIVLSVDMETPELAAQVANAYAEMLDRVNQEKNVSRARNSRRYIEQQLRRTEEELRKASEALARFQQEHRLVALDEQARVAVERAGELKGKIIAKEIELGVLLKTMRADNPAVRQVQRELEEMKRRYNQLIVGGKTGDFLPALEQLPELSRELAQRLRQLKVQETVWQLLNQQYYQARIEEARDVPTVQVLDEAVPPIERVRPRRTAMTLAGALLGAFACVLAILLQRVSERQRTDPNSADHWERIVNEVRADLRRIRRLLTRHRRTEN